MTLERRREIEERLRVAHAMSSAAYQAYIEDVTYLLAALDEAEDTLARTRNSIRVLAKEWEEYVDPERRALCWRMADEIEARHPGIQPAPRVKG